ncbi:hypothetical protein A1O3_06119 [Capronia epimyces CBS 606.96]|uniref:Enoyl reductase (ER) domain-containing protein n=1 Tax=Capronia epimyces CBS 606.96 TaxID=1182542 RepID=W9XZA0_9EURO|nr:uncharacterized protein A1O3_06119 [Capronia epimyces CBS 606.96]EXJ82306.1 hypothetical protein A1O3_06119 [Capronia epimyces CBS 606.96]
MRAYQLQKLVKNIDELEIVETPDLRPHPDKYLIKVHAAAINFFDILQIQGKHQDKPPFPWIAGNEFAGEILAVPTRGGADVPKLRFRKGDRVFGAGLGAFATMIQASEANLRPVPKNWTYVEASSLFYTAPTAYAALVMRAHAKKGDHVLIHGAAGGVGLAAVTIANALGMTVIASVDTEKKRDIVKRFGAHHVVDSKGDWEPKVKSLTPNGRGVDVVIDPLGMIARSLKCIRWDGRLCIVGFAAGGIENIPTNRLLLKNVSLSGLFWGQYAKEDPQSVVEAWDKLFEIIDTGLIVPLNYMEKQFKGLEQISDAMKLLSTGTAWGKIVVDISENENGKTKL